MVDFRIYKERIEERKQRIRDVWEYKKVDHIPIMMTVESNSKGYTVQDMLFDREKQFEQRIECIEESLRLIPDDYIPTAFIDVGCCGIANAFGAQLHYGENPNQSPSVKAPIIKSIEEIYELKKPDIKEAKLICEFIERIRLFLDRTDHSIYVSAMDMNGPTGVAVDLLGSTNFFTLMYDAPEALKYLLEFIADVIIDITEQCIDAAGGIEYLTSTDFFLNGVLKAKKAMSVMI